MARPGIAAAFLILLAVTSTLVVTADDPNDSLGGDASDTRAAPTPLPGSGSYAGWLPNADADWWSLPLDAAPGCVALEAAGAAGIEATLAVRKAGADHGVQAPVSTNASQPTRLLLAQSGGTTGVIGFTRDPGVGLRGYAFNVSSTPARAGGAPTTPTPAGLLASAVPLPAPCVSGSLDPLAGLGHTTDVYSFVGTAGTQVVYSLASPGPVVQLRVIDPSGMDAGSAIVSDGVGLATLPQDGTYYAVASRSQGTATADYVFALLNDPSPCRPSCTLSN